MSATSMKIRLTRRGRIVLAALAALTLTAAIAIAALLASPNAAADESSSDGLSAAKSQFGYVVVQPGETLWSVATALDASSDPRDVIAEIVRLNQLSGSDVQAGQPIAVPMRYADVPGVVAAEDLGVAI